MEAKGSQSTVSRPMRNWRGTIWAIGTVAAAAGLLVMLLIPDPPKVADLAQNDQPGAATAEQESDGVSRAQLASQVPPSPESSKGSFRRKAEAFSADSPVPSDDALGVHDSEALQLESAEADVISGGRALEKTAPMPPPPTSEMKPRMLPMEEAPAQTAASPLSRTPSVTELAGVAQEGLSRIAADGPSTELIASAMQQNDPKYLVHVIVNQSDTGGQAFDRSLANNEIHYKKQAELSGLALRSLVRSNAGRRSSPLPKEREELASPFEQDHATPQTARAEAPRLVIVAATATRLRDAVNELIRDRDEFQKVEIYEVASEDDATVELKTGDNVWRFRRALPFELEQSGLEMAPGGSNTAKDARKADLNLSEALSDRPAAPPEDPPPFGLTDPSSAKYFGERIRGVQGPVHVLFVLSPSLPTQIPSITAAEPVAEPDENR